MAVRWRSVGRGRSSRPLWVVGSVLSWVVLVAPRARAYDFEIQTRSEAQGYQLRRYSRDGLSFVNRLRFAQSLGLRVYNLIDADPVAARRRGRPPALVFVQAHLRFHTDFGAFAPDTAAGGRAIPELREDRFELLLGSVEARHLWGWVDLSLGRQLDAELFDFFAYDGLRARLSTPFWIFVETCLGAQVRRADPFGLAVFQTDGTSGDSAAERAWMPTFGLALGLDERAPVELRLAYRGVASRAAATPFGRPESLPRRWGLDEELVFAHVAVAPGRWDSRLAAGLRYNLLVAQLDEVHLEATQGLGRRYQAALELLQSRPHFDGDSIFNVFATEPFSEAAGRLRWRPESALDLEARAGYRWVWRAADERGEVAPGSLSLSALARWQAERLASTLELYYLDGYGGLRLGGELFGRWWSPRWVFGRRLALEGRASLVRLDGLAPGAAAVTNFGLQAGLRVRLLPAVWAQLLVEDNVSRLQDSALRVLGVLDMSFAP